MVTTEESRGLTLFAILGLLGSAIMLVVAGLRGDFPAMFGFSNGWAVVASIQVGAAVSLWVNDPTPDLPSF